MANLAMIMGDSGSGKTASLRNMSPVKTLVIQPVKKPLPFRSKEWKRFSSDDLKGSILASDNSKIVIKAIRAGVKAGKKVIIIDDAQYFMSNELMRQAHVKGYDKFLEIAGIYWELITFCVTLPDDVRVYFFTHAQTSDEGFVKPKTIGKMLDNQVCIEGMFTTVLRSRVQDNKHFFTTRNNGADVVKAPLGMFDDDQIDNCLNLVDETICEYEGIENDTQTKRQDVSELSKVR